MNNTIQPNTPAEAIELERARLEGKSIQCNALGNNADDPGGWMDVLGLNSGPNFGWRFDLLRYRVAPSEPRVWYVNEYSGEHFGRLHKSISDANRIRKYNKSFVRMMKVVEVI